MSVLLNPHPGNSIRASAGFTLLELLTVLFVIGLSASVILPNLPTLFDRMAFAMDRDSLIRSLNRLPYEAADSNRDYVLFGEFPYVAVSEETNEYISSEDLPASVPFRSGRLKRAKPSLPDQWTLTVAEPIFFRSSGFCSGGRVTATVGATQYDLVARAPLCQFREADF